MLKNLKIGDQVQFEDGTFSTVTFVNFIMGVNIYVATKNSCGTYCVISGIKLASPHDRPDKDIILVKKWVESPKSKLEQLAKKLGGRVIWD